MKECEPPERVAKTCPHTQVSEVINDSPRSCWEGAQASPHWQGTCSPLRPISMWGPGTWTPGVNPGLPHLNPHSEPPHLPRCLHSQHWRGSPSTRLHSAHSPTLDRSRNNSAEAVRGDSETRGLTSFASLQVTGSETLPRGPRSRDDLTL